MAVVAAVVSLTTLQAAGAADDGPDSVSPALQRAESALGGDAPGTDLTLAMRDLAYARDSLSGAERARADRLLARPTDPDDPYGSYYGLPTSNRCYQTFCLYWVTAGDDAPSLVDSNADGVPDWVDTTRDTVTNVLRSFELDGYRAPLPDAGPPYEGATTQLDIYLANLGDRGAYGYCVPDVDNYESVTPGYCVIDNDFSTEEFGGTPLLNLGVTAAHELFHATQFAYDATESAWFLESTATWMEDELFDASNDNYQYLRYGPMGIPTMSLDDPDELGGNVYGSWIFWRYLAERLPQGGGRDVVRKSLERAGDGPGELNQHGLQAVRSYVEAQGQDWASVFARFAAANRVPENFYEEGAAYPAAPDAATHFLTPRRTSTGNRSMTLDHLASRNILIRPTAGMRGKWSLKVAVDLPDRSTGMRAVATIHQRGGAERVTLLDLDSQGAGSFITGFRPGDVIGVALTFVNAGTRYDCDLGTDWNCGGTSLDDGRKVKWKAQAVRKR